jgi:hypothetical protein
MNSRIASPEVAALGARNRAAWRRVRLAPAEVPVDWSRLGIQGTQPVRDLRQRKDLGTFTHSFKASVPRHGAVFVKIGKPGQ